VLSVRHPRICTDSTKEHQSEINEGRLRMTWAQGILFVLFLFVFFIGITEGYAGGGDEPLRKEIETTRGEK
jgi:hypothetical protein